MEFNHSLDYLPGALSGLTVRGSYTHTKPEIPIAGSAENFAVLDLAYKRGPLSLNLNTAWTGESEAENGPSISSPSLAGRPLPLPGPFPAADAERHVFVTGPSGQLRLVERAVAASGAPRLRIGVGLDQRLLDEALDCRPRAKSKSSMWESGLMNARRAMVSIVRDLIGLHEGQVTVEVSPRGGLRLTLAFPMVHA